VRRDGPAQTLTTLLCCAVAAFCEGIDLQAAGVAAGGIVAEFKPSAEQLGTFFGASTLGLFIGALLGGRLSDSLGRKRVLVASIALFGLLSLLAPLAWDMQSLSWARLLTGLGLGGCLPNLVALVNEASAAHRRSANVALVYGGMPFGGALASLISLSIAAAHWRWIFIVGGVAPLLLAPIMLGVLPESPAFLRAADGAAAAGMPQAGMPQAGMPQAGMPQAGMPQAGMPQAGMPQVGVPQAGVPRAGVPRAGSVRALLSEGRVLTTLLLWVSFFLGLLTLYLLLNWLPTLLVGNGLTGPQAAAAQIAFNVGGGLATLLMGQLLEGRLRTISILTTFIALPLLLLLLSRAPAQLAPVLSIVFLLGCAVLAAQAFLYAVAPGCYPTAIRGIGVGAAVAIGRLGSIAGPKLGGSLRAAGLNFAQLLEHVLPIVVIASVAALLLAWHTRGLRGGADSS
jgi:AAHS family 3-hydroxyphenylpropionic acid transporter